MDAIPLLVSLDQAYLPQLQVLLTSLCWNNPGEQFVIYLLHSGIPTQALAPVVRQCEHLAYQFHPIFVEDRLFADAPTTKQYPKEMYYRLLAGSLLPRQLNRILYLDPDILVINPLRPLWEMDLEGRLFAAAAHTGKTDLANQVNRVRLGTDHDYYNSGVLLMNLEACRREISTDQIFRFVAEHERELLLPDQDILNALYGRRILPLDDAVWNYDARNYNTYRIASGGPLASAACLSDSAFPGPPSAGPSFVPCHRHDFTRCGGGQRSGDSASAWPGSWDLRRRALE